MKQALTIGRIAVAMVGTGLALLFAGCAKHTQVASNPTVPCPQVATATNAGSLAPGTLQSATNSGTPQLATATNAGSLAPGFDVTGPGQTEPYVVVTNPPPIPATRRYRHRHLTLVRRGQRDYLSDGDGHYYNVGRTSDGDLYPAYDDQYGHPYRLYYDSDRDSYYRVARDNYDRRYYRQYNGDPNDVFYIDSSDYGNPYHDSYLQVEISAPRRYSSRDSWLIAIPLFTAAYFEFQPHYTYAAAPQYYASERSWVVRQAYLPSRPNHTQVYFAQSGTSGQLPRVALPMAPRWSGHKAPAVVSLGLAANARPVSGSLPRQSAGFLAQHTYAGQPQHQAHVQAAASLHQTHVQAAASLHQTHVQVAASLHQTHQRAAAAQHQTHQRAAAAQHQTHQRAAAAQHQTHQRAAAAQHQTHQRATAAQHQTHQRAAAAQHQTHQRGAASQGQAHQRGAASQGQAHQRGAASQGQAHQRGAASQGQAHQRGAASQGQAHQRGAASQGQAHQRGAASQGQAHQRGAASQGRSGGGQQQHAKHGR